MADLIKRSVVKPGLSKPLSLLILVCLMLALAATAIPASVEGPTVTLKPICGTADSVIQLTGRGWKPGNDCDSVRYAYYWDNSPFKCEDAALEDCIVFGPPYGSADDRIDCGAADKLYKGPWYMTDLEEAPDTPLPDICLRVPEDSDPGTHVLKVSMEIKRQGGPWQERQCAVREWEQLSTIEQPWKNWPTTWPSGTPEDPRKTIKIRFDPRNVCDVPPCSLLVFVQAVRLEGEFDQAPSPRAVTPTEMVIASSEVIENFMSASGYFIDNGASGVNPYYPKPQWGFRGDSPSKGTREASMEDTPGGGAAWRIWPPSMTKAIFYFEVSAFCGQGEGAGRWLGNATWRWEYTRGGATLPQIIPGPQPNRESGPSAGIASALAAYEAYYGWVRPTPQETQEGGDPCSQ